MASRPKRKLFGAVVALSTLVGSAAFADFPSRPRQADDQAEQAASVRWQELRKEIFKTSEKPESVRAPSAAVRPFPERTTLEQVAGFSFSTPSSSGIEQVSARREPGYVIHSFSDFSEPLAVPKSDSAQLVSLPEFLAMGEKSQEGRLASLPLPPEPVPAADISPSGIPSAPGGELFGDQIDTLFQPITRIQPYQNYSPSAAAQGKVRYDYICPQPDSIPKDKRVSCPDMLALPQHGSTSRNFATTQYTWLPTNVFHNPLYFEDVALERYGQQYPVGIQPFVSLGRFGIQFLGLPYQMAIDPVHREIYALGYYRPGDCPPELEYRIPWNAKAAATAAGVYTGFAFLIP